MSRGSPNSSFDTYEKLREYLTTGQAPAGSKLNQGELCKQLRVGKTPLLKALHKLETEGLVDYVGNRGFYVHRLSLRESYEIFELREGLEKVLIGNVMRLLNDDNTDYMEAIFKPFMNGKQKIDPVRYWRADIKFHQYLVSLCQNGLMKRIMLNYQIYPRAYTAGLIRPPAETIDEHLAIIKSLRERNADKATKLSVEHVTKTKLLLASLLERMTSIGLSPDEIYVNDLDAFGNVSVQNKGGAKALKKGR